MKNRVKTHLLASATLIAGIGPFLTTPVAAQSSPNAVQESVDAPAEQTDPAQDPVTDSTQQSETEKADPAQDPVADSTQQSEDDDDTLADKKDSAKKAKKPKKPKDGDDRDIIVTGIRGSVISATKKKRDSLQVVDTINAEDSGKLPDNNVVDALARVPGVAIDRGNGRGTGITIRGIGDGSAGSGLSAGAVQTTVNGQQVGQNQSRSINLADIPAELIKSVSVYKTRTANQIEGGYAGTVDVQLRRPLELKNGLTLAGSLRGEYNAQVKKVSQFGSILISDKINTGIGKIGLLLNVGYVNQYWNEPTARNDALNYTYNKLDPKDTFRSDLYKSLPADTRDRLLIPYALFYGVNFGNRKQPSVNAVLQWQPSDRLNFVLEGNYFGDRSDYEFSNLNINTRDDRYSASDLRVAPGGAVLGMTITGPDRVFAGVASGLGRNRGDNFHTNFETHWSAPGLRIDASAQRDWSKSEGRGRNYYLSIFGLKTLRVDFSSPNIPSGVPFVHFKSEDLTPENLRINGFHDDFGTGKGSSYSGQVDIGIDVSRDKLLRNLQIGTRFSSFRDNFQFSYRDGNFADGGVQDADLPTVNDIPGVDTATTTPAIRGAEGFSWTRLNNQQLVDHWDAVRALLVAKKARAYGSGAGALGDKSYLLWQTPYPIVDEPAYNNGNEEKSFAAYVNANYAFKFIVPISGAAGLRVVNTWGRYTGINILQNYTNPDGTVSASRAVTFTGSGNYLDYFPSVTGIANLAKGLQLRAAWSRNVGRPGFGALNQFANIDFVRLANPREIIDIGNPDLKAITTNDYNLYLEYYFGRGGVISLGGFYKQQKGLFYSILRRGVLPGYPETGERLIRQLTNAGPGMTQGLEGQVTSFFTFLPGFLKNFGVNANATWIPKAYTEVPLQLNAYTDLDPTQRDFSTTYVKQDYPGLSKVFFNIIGLYDTPTFSARVAYNWRSKVTFGIDTLQPQFNAGSLPTSRLDAAINITPLRFMTLSLEGTNLLGVTDRQIYLTNPELNPFILQQARTIQFSLRARF